MLVGPLCCYGRLAGVMSIKHAGFDALSVWRRCSLAKQCPQDTWNLNLLSFGLPPFALQV